MYQVRCDLVPPGKRDEVGEVSCLKRSCLVTSKNLTGIHLLHLKCRDWENNGGFFHVHSGKRGQVGPFMRQTDLGKSRDGQ